MTTTTATRSPADLASCLAAEADDMADLQIYLRDLTGHQLHQELTAVVSSATKHLSAARAQLVRLPGLLQHP